MPWPSADSAYEHGSLSSRCSAFMQLPTVDAHSMTKTSQVWGCVLLGAGYLSLAQRMNGTFFCATILGFVQKAREDIQWTVDKQQLHKMIATQKEPAPGFDGIHYGIRRCAGGLGSHFLSNAKRAVVEGGSVPHALLRVGPFSFPICRRQSSYLEVTGCTASIDPVELWLQNHHHGDLLWLA